MWVQCGVNDTLNRSVCDTPTTDSYWIHEFPKRGGGETYYLSQFPHPKLQENQNET